MVERSGCGSFRPRCCNGRVHRIILAPKRHPAKAVVSCESLTEHLYRGVIHWVQWYTYGWAEQSPAQIASGPYLESDGKSVR